VRKVIACFALVLVVAFTAFFAFAAGGREKGRADAERDVKSGTLKIYAVGESGMSRQKEYDTIFRQEYGVTMIRKPTTIPKNEKEYASGYNEVSVAKVIDKYGYTVFADVRDKAGKMQ